MKVFVYGTLKKGFRNHHFLGESRFVSPAKTKPKFRLFDCGLYPCLKESDNGYEVNGELYEVESDKVAKSLDWLEGVDSGLYRKEVIPVVTPAGEEQATVYIYNKSVDRFLDCGASWPR